MSSDAGSTGGMETPVRFQYRLVRQSHLRRVGEFLIEIWIHAYVLQWCDSTGAWHTVPTLDHDSLTAESKKEIQENQF